MSQHQVGLCPVDSNALVRYMLRVARKRGVLDDGAKARSEALAPYLPSNYLPDIRLTYPLLGEPEARAAMVLDTYDYHALVYASHGAWPQEACEPQVLAPQAWSDLVGLEATAAGVRPFVREAPQNLGADAPGDCLCGLPARLAKMIEPLLAHCPSYGTRRVGERLELTVTLPRAGLQHLFANNPHQADILGILQKAGVDEQRLAGLKRASGLFGVPYYDKLSGYQEYVVVLDVAQLVFTWESDRLVQAHATLLISDKIMGYAGLSFKGGIAYQWHITDECDQRCKHCYLFGEDARAACVTTPWDQLMHTLHQIEKRCARAHAYPTLAISGGDPLLHPRFWDFAEELHRRGISWTVMGNPFHLSAEVCRRLRQLGCFQYQMSLDGLEKFHDHLRKPGSYRATLAALKPLQEAGLQTQLMATASKQNLSDILTCMDVAADHGVSSFAFARYCATSPAKARELYPTAEEYRAFLLAYWNKKQAYERAGCKTVFKTKEHLFTLLRWELGDFVLPAWAAQRDRVCEGCHLGTKATICANGDLLACRRMPSRVGNIMSDDLWDAEHSDEMRRYARVEDIKGCATCELLYWCRGCRAVGVNATGDLAAADPMCWKIKAD